MTHPFNKAKYKALLEGLEISEVSYHVVKGTETLRFDSEYFFKEYLRIEQLIKCLTGKFTNFANLGICVDCSAFYPALEPYYGEGEYPFIRVGDVKEWIDFDGCIKLPRGIIPNFPTLKRVFPGDIVITKGGSIGNVGYVSQESCVSRDLIFLNTSKLDYEKQIMLYLYLSSKFAFKQMVRSSSQCAQPHLTTTLIKKFDIFWPGKNLVHRLSSIFLNSRDAMNKSQISYSVAEEVLLCNLGLQDWSSMQGNISYKSFVDFQISGRLDAEYYQPKYDELKKIVYKKACHVKLISEMELFNARGQQPEYVENGDLSVINSKHILENGLDYDNFEKTACIYWEKQERSRVFKNDILIYTTGANIGRTAIYMINEKALASNHVNILRVNTENKIYVAFVMNSLIGRLQTEQLSAGSAQAELYPKDISHFYIPFVSEDIQTQISDKVQEFFSFRKESKRLLELAKRVVEVAIEQGEDAALHLLEIENA